MVERFKPQKKMGSPRFKKGMKALNPNGRPKGVPNKVTKLVKDALSGSIEQLGMLEPIYATKVITDGEHEGETVINKNRIIGWKPSGKGGAQGYLVWLGCNHPNAYATLIGRLMPIQINATATMDVNVRAKYTPEKIKAMSLEEKIAAMKEITAASRALPPADPSKNVTLDNRTGEPVDA